MNDDIIREHIGCLTEMDFRIKFQGGWLMNGVNVSIGGAYSQFYKGTESIKSYGDHNAPGKKDTLVRYDFSTTDDQGNKIMDKMSKEEALHAMNDIRSMYGDNVILEFSGDGLAALSESIKAQSRKNCTEPTEEEKAVMAQKQAELDKAIVHMENTHRLFIPNIQTNAKLYGSLEQADEAVVSAANGIIKNYLMPSNLAGVSETQRKERIAFGLEEAKYLAENYLDAAHGKDFISAMETIAQYGLNGKVAENGKVTYQIEMGPLVGMSDDYVNPNDVLREKAPELYLEMKELNQRIIAGESGWGNKFIELQERINKALGASSNSYDSKTQRYLTNYEEAVSQYKNWKNKMEKTQLPSVFENIQYQEIQRFMASLQGQSSLSSDWINDQVSRLNKWLTPAQS